LFSLLYLQQVAQVWEFPAIRKLCFMLKLQMKWRYHYIYIELFTFKKYVCYDVKILGQCWRRKCRWRWINRSGRIKHFGSQELSSSKKCV